MRIPVIFLLCVGVFCGAERPEALFFPYGIAFSQNETIAAKNPDISVWFNPEIKRLYVFTQFSRYSAPGFDYKSNQSKPEFFFQRTGGVGMRTDKYTFVAGGVSSDTTARFLSLEFRHNSGRIVLDFEDSQAEKSLALIFFAGKPQEFSLGFSRHVQGGVREDAIQLGYSYHFGSLDSGVSYRHFIQNEQRFVKKLFFRKRYKEEKSGTYTKTKKRKQVFADPGIQILLRNGFTLEESVRISGLLKKQKSFGEVAAGLTERKKKNLYRILHAAQKQ